MSADDVDERYKELMAACWAVFENEGAAAARISMLHEVYPEYAMRKLREDPGFYGPLRGDMARLADQRDAAFATTALTIREKAREFKDALQEQAEREMEKERDRTRERQVGRSRRNERER